MTSNDGSPTLNGLPQELIELILDYIEPNHNKIIHIDKALTSRQFLSEESLKPEPSSPDSIPDIGKLRLVCKKLCEIGTPYLFTEVAIRFSKDGLERLEKLAQWTHLARHVKTFSYLVPHFFKGDPNNLDALRQDGRLPFDLNVLRRKVAEQRTILAQESDAQILRQAIAKFTSLQLIRLLRLADKENFAILEYLLRHEDARDVINLDWSLACSHASQTIGTALLTSSTVEWNRFSLPMLSPASAQFLKKGTGPRSVSRLAERLTCLTLHFEDGENLDEKVQDLSEVFKTVFTKAKRMKSVHIGFPSHRPLTLPLEAVFHNVVWEDLVAFGIQGWELDDEEIIAMARRHQRTLRGIRLRDVHLKEGSKWSNVLPFLRDQMQKLQWVSLRRIGYAEYYQSQQFAQNAGAEVPFLDDSESPSSDEDEDEDEDDDEDHDAPRAGPSNRPGSDSGNGDEQDSQDDYSDSHEDSDDEHGPEANEMDFPNLNSPSTPTSAPWCSCAGRSQLDPVDELEDDSLIVSNAKRKFWEKWVLRRCPEHSDR